MLNKKKLLRNPDSNVLERLSRWRQLTKVQYREEDPEVLAGRDTEKYVAHLVDTHMNYKDAHSFVGKRVPSTMLKRRFEIDLIVLTRKKFHFLEVKNWSGQLNIVGDQWV